MTCEHIEKAKKKINELIGKYNDNSSSYFYETCDPYIKESDIKSCVNCLTEGLDDYLSDDVAVLNRLGEFMNRYGKISVWTIKRIRGNVLYQHLSNIFDELKGCDCYNEAVRKTADKLEVVYDKQYEELKRKWQKDINDYNNLKDKYNKLVDEYNDKNSDYQDMKERYDDTREELHGEKLGHANKMGDEKLKHLGEKSQLQIQNTKLQEKLEAANSEKIDLRKRLKDKEVENDRLLIKLDDKNNQLTVLRLESGKKDNELERKGEEIRNLKSQAKSSDKRAESSQEELLNEKIRSEKGNLELFATELTIGLEQINSLSRYHERLLQARKSHNQANIETHENNITRIKEEFQEAEISIVNIQEICRKCERLAEFRWELEQKQNQYEARQEVPPHNNN